GPSYPYWPSGRLKFRTWARGVVTSYTYNHAGEPETISYSGEPAPGTPGTTILYDRRGRQATVTRNAVPATTVNLSFNDANQPTGESYPSDTGGTLAGLTLTVGYDGYL